MLSNEIIGCMREHFNELDASNEFIVNRMELLKKIRSDFRIINNLETIAG